MKQPNSQYRERMDGGVKNLKKIKSVSIDTDNPENRSKFIDAWVEYDDPIVAAREAFGNASETEIERVAKLMLASDAVCREREEMMLQVRDDEVLLPSKQEFAYEVWRKIRESGKADASLKLLELFAKTMGYLEKPGDSKASGATPVSKVMVVAASDTDEEWGEALKRQQEKLRESSEMVEQRKRKVSA